MYSTIDKQEISANKLCKVMNDLEMNKNQGDAHATQRNWLFYGNDMINGTLFRFMQAIFDHFVFHFYPLKVVD